MGTTAATIDDAQQFARRVLIIVPDKPVPFNRRVWQQATELARNGYIVSVICPRSKGYTAPFEEIDGVKIFRHPAADEAKSPFGYAIESTATLFWAFMLSGRVFLSVGFDAIAACNPPDNVFIIGCFYKAFFAKRFLFEQHELTPEWYEARYPRKGMLHSLTLWFERMSFKLSNVAIVANETLKKIATTRGKMKQQDVFVVRPGPNLEYIRPMQPQPSLKRGRKYLVGYVGIMGRHKGIRHLIEATRIIAQDMKRDDIEFVLVGDGPELGNLRKLAAIEGVADYMTFSGNLADKEMLQALSTADICVNVDEAGAGNDESTMSKIMEYMALGKPIVQFDLAESRSIAGAASLYAGSCDAADLAAKIVELLGDAERRREMGEAGRRRAESELAWSYEAPKLLAAYDALFAEKAPTKKD